METPRIRKSRASSKDGRNYHQRRKTSKRTSESVRERDSPTSGRDDIRVYKEIPMTKDTIIEEAVKYYKKCDEGIHSWIKLESNLPAGRQHSFRCYFCGEELEGFHCSGGSPSGKGRHYSCHLFETPDEYIRRIRKELELKNRE